MKLVLLAVGRLQLEHGMITRQAANIPAGHLQAVWIVKDVDQMQVLHITVFVPGMVFNDINIPGRDGIGLILHHVNPTPTGDNDQFGKLMAMRGAFRLGGLGKYGDGESTRFHVVFGFIIINHKCALFVPAI